MYSPRIPKDSGYQAFRLLQFVFILIPIIAGFDKFFYFLVSWNKYLAPSISSTFGHSKSFMYGVGVIEIIAGIGVLWKPKIFSYVVALWLFCIVINLFLLGHYMDIALRDVGLMLSATALGRLSARYGS